ncbi:MAG: COX15/CtaA family protein [Acidobacteria bacterium]|nr:COX15/CtaA family protein [Acidobacteriota bacterium]
MTRGRLLFHGLILLTLSATAVLVFAGGMVTSTGSGLAVPDWPLSNGTLFPRMVGGVFYEHGHRLIAGAVALMTTLLVVMAWRTEPRATVRHLSAATLGLVLLQATLGGLTVLFLLPTAVSVAHAGMANLFFAGLVLMWRLTSRAHVRALPVRPAARSLWRGWLLLAAVLYGQMLLGALMRHSGAGLAIPDFPLAFGRLLPPLETWPVIIHFSHRLGAILVLAVSIPLLAASMRASGRCPRLLAPTASLALLLPLQVTLGGLTIWTGKAPILTSLHVLGGTLCLGASIWGAVEARRGRQTTPATSVASLHSPILPSGSRA